MALSGITIPEQGSEAPMAANGINTTILDTSIPSQCHIGPSVDSNEHQDKYPQRQTLWESVRRNLHCRCLCLTISICACMSFIFWCQLVQITQILNNLQPFDEKLFDSMNTEKSCDEGIVMLPILCMSMLYVAYLVECWHSTTRLVLLYRTSSAHVYSYIDQMRHSQPIIWWKAACYHHVRHSRPIARYRSNGTGYNFATSTTNGTSAATVVTPTSSPNIYYERINSHVSGSYFSYSSCGVKDISKSLHGLEYYPITRIYFSKGFAFANERSAREFDEQRSIFFASNENYDQFLEIREGLDLVGVNFQQYMIATGDPKRVPWYSSHFAFWVFSLVLLSWPLRILLEYNTAYVNYQIVKLFGINYSPNESQYPIMSRASTIDTLSNYMIAPSYSEAMLAERIYCLRSCSNSTFDETTAQTKPKSNITLSRNSLRINQVPYLKHPTIKESTNSRLDRQQQTDYIATINQQNCSQSRQQQHFQENKCEILVESNSQQCEPPSYEEVIEDNYCSDNQPNKSSSSKNCWYHLIGRLLISNINKSKFPRSLTDKDFFQKLVTAQYIRKPWTSFGDISNNLITNV